MMRAVISVSLNGRAFQLEDDAHTALASYLDGAAAALTGNPDRSEILADLEQAIADKCERYLGPHKNVLVRNEIEQVIGEMGPVDCGTGSAAPEGAQAAGAGSGGADSAPSGAQTGAGASKRLYQISDGALISGVCKGIAVYLNVDVTLVRVVFVIAAVLTGGLALLVYLILMFIVPYANTPEELAAARGLPFNARVLVEQAKLKAAQLAGAATQAAMHPRSPEARAQWRAEWRKTRMQWRQEWRRNRAQWRSGGWTGAAPAASIPPMPPPPPPFAHFISGLIAAALGLVAALVTLGWVIALFSLVTTGAMFGWNPFHLPLWLTIICLILVYQAIVWPLRAVRYGMLPPLYGYPHPWHSFWDALVGVFFLACVVWYITQHGHDLHQSLQTLQQNAAPAWHQFVQAWQTLFGGSH